MQYLNNSTSQTQNFSISCADTNRYLHYHFNLATNEIERNESGNFENDMKIIKEMKKACSMEPEFGHYHFQLGLYQEWTANQLKHGD
jgi:hypothetical protein